MQLAGRSQTLVGAKANRRSDSFWIPRWTFQPHAQPRLAGRIAKQPGLRGVLRYHQVRTAILIVISHGGAALLAVNHDAALLAGHRAKPAAAVPFQNQTSARVVARNLRVRAEQILADKEVFVAVTIEIADA